MERLLQLAALLLLLGPSTASAEPRFVLGYLRGDRDGVMSRQLQAALCGPFECAPRSSAYTGTRPDFAKARAQGVSAILYGAVTGKEPNRLVWLALLTTSTKPARTWTLDVSKGGRLSRSAVRGLVRDLEARLGAGRPAPRPPSAPPRSDAVEREAPRATSPAVQESPPPRATPPVASTLPPDRAPEREAHAMTAPRAPARLQAAPAEARRPIPTSPIAAVEQAPPPPRWGAFELGAYVTGRELDYGGISPTGPGSLATMSVDAVLCPRAYLEVFPAARSENGLLAGLGVFADYRRSVGFEVEAGPTVHSAELSRLAAGLLWRLPPVGGLRLGVTPSVSYERRDLTVGDGVIPGLPDAHLRGVRLGAGLSLPVSRRLALLLGGGWVLWTEAGDLVEGEVPFFPSGSASAIEVEAGVSIALIGRFSLRMMGEFSSTSYDLDPDPTSTYRVSSATDRYVGGRAALRGEF